MKTPFFLTEVAEDWTPANLATAQKAILDAEIATLARTDIKADPLLDTPNLAIFRGVVRWNMVQKHLYMAGQRGEFQGITADWTDLGGVFVLELRGKHTSVTTHHLMEEGDSPRESVFRKRGREVNAVSPLLKGWEELEPAKEKELIHLLLVHGGKSKEFAYLRAYTDATDRAVYRQLSTNIKELPTLLPSIDFEPVAEPTVELSPAETIKKAVNENL